MHIIVLILGAAILYFAISKYLKKQPEKFNDMFGKFLAVALGLSAFFILIKGNIAAGVVLGTGAVLSWQGSLWTYLKAKAEGPEVKNVSNDKMTYQEALEILELNADPAVADIKAAHHRLMMKIHPDQGGSAYFAAKLNQAKDLLLKNK